MRDGATLVWSEAAAPSDCMRDSDGCATCGAALFRNARRTSICAQSRTGRLASFRCSVRRCIFNARAVAETLPSCSASTRWMCSHSRRSTDAGARSTSIALLPPWRRERGDHFVGGRGFAQVVDRTEFDRFDGGRDARVAGQHDDARRRFDFVQALDQLQSGRAGHLQIDDGEFRRIRRQPGRMRRRRRRRPTTA